MDGLQGGNRNSPMCGSGEWETGEIVSGTSIDDTRNAVPMVQVVCVNCGHVMLFAALPIGLGVEKDIRGS